MKQWNIFEILQIKKHMMKNNYKMKVMCKLDLF